MNLGLGAVQFGADYGVTNKRGKVPPREVARILRTAAAAGISIIDTAAAYGESESVLGAALWDGHPFRIVTKIALPRNYPAGDQISRMWVAGELGASLERLRQTRIYGLLFHRADDLIGSAAGPLVSATRELKDQGLVGSIGVSAYSGQQLDSILSAFTPDIVQVPLSVLDQRLLASGHLSRLKERGVEIHARSVFLQGALLAAPDALPRHFAPYRAPLERVRAGAKALSMSALEFALEFIASVEEVDAAIIGVSGIEELEEVLKASSVVRGQKRDWNHYSCADEALVDPSRWRT